jgi:nitrate/nitrite transporter NarK
MFGGIAVGAGGLAVATVPQMATWRAPYWSSLLLVTLGVGGLLLARDRSPGSSLPRTRAVFSGGLFADKRLYRLGLLFSCSYGVTVVIANWVTELLDHHSSLSHGGAAVVGSLTLLVSIVSRPLGGWILHKHSDRLRATVGVSLACGCLGTVALLVAQPTWLAVVGAILVGIGGGISFAPVFTAAALARPDAPAASIGLVSGLGNLMVLFGTPLAGLTFAMSGGGRIGFAVIAGCWLAALVLLPDRPTLGAR